MEELITRKQLEAYDKKKAPTIIYVDELPAIPENTLYGIWHEGPESRVTTTRFTDILSSYFTEESNGKWTVNESFSVEIDGNVFRSVALVSGKYFIYKNQDYTEMYADSYQQYTEYIFTVYEDIAHVDIYVGDEDKETYEKIANVDEVERYFIRESQKGQPNGVASLDINGRVPVEQMPVQAFVYLGQWDASTGTYPPDADTPGDFYEISVTGTIDGEEYLIGDWLVWSSDGWHKSENKNYVTEVNKKRGIVKVYGDNTEIETPTETSDARTIKEYIDDITVDGESKDENDNYTSKAVIDVTELPETLNDKVYVKSTEDAEGNVIKTVYAKDTKLVTQAEDKNNIKSVNDETPDEDGKVTIDGDNINVKVEEEAETLNTTLNRFFERFGKTKTVDGNEPDENGNTVSKAVIEVEDMPETVGDKVYIKTEDEENKTVYAKDTKLITQEEFDKDVVKTVNTIKPTNGNVQTVVPITKAEYQALVDADEDDPNVVYAVYDEQSSVDIINDFQISENLTWSSSKIHSAITAATPIVFDDSKVSSTMGWTSDKIKKEIDAKSGIDDALISKTSSWSSDKTNTEITTATNDMATQTWASNTFEPANSDLATKTWVGNNYEPKNDDLLTKTNADTLYEPKNADLATKTWVGNQGYLTEHQSLDGCVKHSEVYVQNGILYINL